MYMFSTIQGELAHVLLSRSAVYANWNAIDRAFDVFEVSDDQGGKIRRHFRGGGELYGVLISGPGRIRYDFVVGDRDLAFVRDRGDVKRRLVLRFVERGKRPARISGFKLRRCIFAAVVVFAEI